MEHDDLSGTSFRQVRLRDARFRFCDLSGARLDKCDLHDVRMTGIESTRMVLDGEILQLVVNGVDVMPLVEAELARADPDHAAMKPDDPAGFVRAWDVLERRWAETVDRARAFDPELLHVRVEDEWSFVETLRHLCYATDAWVNRVILGDPDPWDPLDLPFDTLLDLAWEHPTDLRPTLDEVLALRADRQATVRRVLEALTAEQLAGTTEPVEGKGWPPPDSYSVKEALLIVLNEEWHHRRYAERDLAALSSRPPGAASDDVRRA
jgi:uncharacterized damage-inducible protein DinB